MGEAGFYHPDRQRLVCVCVWASACDWCAVLCCMSRRMIGLLIFPLAEHKSLFYPPSLSLSRVKCLRSRLLCFASGAASAVHTDPPPSFFGTFSKMRQMTSRKCDILFVEGAPPYAGLKRLFFRRHTNTLRRAAANRDGWLGGGKTMAAKCDTPAPPTLDK